MKVTQDDRMIRQGLSFIKMHGLGNDYVYIDRFAESASFDPAALARVLADRQRVSSCGKTASSLHIVAITRGA